jgi:chemotaxis protein MotB
MTAPHLVGLPLARRRAVRLGLASVLLAGLAACVSLGQYDQLEQAYQQLNARLSAEIAADQVQITKLQGQLKVTLKDEILFPEGGWRITERAKQTLGKLVPTLAGLQQTKVVVDGYTDNLPIGPELRRDGIASNFDLSSRRADTVVNYLASQGVNPALLSAQGFGDTRPVASNDTEEGRAKNRRIEVTLVGPGT